ncbi:NEDD8-activating enzyme E1 catalytic subunit-like isoform X1 [Salvelinus fontinalis]|uniref:NEDD8-activating enzyme E1 catalytic subunit-like isoform X1 n=1 Tax=Salvelinus fontinalis TaxID=8038 RepID=UPI002486CACF|nr:NEDD8-activating enzyme E1 catalytic subunit-like isoform X1 [Salvelinus fontinalis]XP_055748108.1 NEDD8-activating enzyme E1 catalytic subunit-like isoform X1 [Salvelinus fontinalis]XP_055748109.1 NEDD8-activating enzyme E1 catalytic subunit-like isoform X1 [Salvelinus fontinalis]XP_055748110.1 NEDD8-activating enzyme E1 catalytic subunit-like isoform X1 [Salvelinus fontinalis]XP_055748111.1 NEDD8-activating enzyme E1 catalytic subunit-like isoform X1 [Salvelinus fontinalis]XP_055748112.1 
MEPCEEPCEPCEERPGPFTHPDFEPSIESLGFLLETCKILVIGAGGLGCELLKNLISLLSYEDGVLDPSSIIPLIDGGTEGFKGNARVILPGMTACIDCTLELYPPQIHFPMCTIASMPRLPEHCVEYVRMLQWPKDKPFGDGDGLDGDNPEHIQRAQERAVDYSITGVTYRLTQGVVKRIIPAVASTNAVIAAACSTEVFKIASSTSIPLNNYLVFNIVDGLYTYTFEAERKSDRRTAQLVARCPRIYSSHPLPSYRRSWST